MRKSLELLPLSGELHGTVTGLLTILNIQYASVASKLDSKSGRTGVSDFIPNQTGIHIIGLEKWDYRKDGGRQPVLHKQQRGLKPQSC